jgi:hypothetical protein
MISHRLDTALREAIQAHADRNRQGMQDLDEILTALAEVAATYLADVPPSAETRARTGPQHPKRAGAAERPRPQVERTSMSKASTFNG